jgi:hypothetical protein
MAKDLTKITNMKAAEVSLVKRGANQKKRFPLFKSEDQGMDQEILDAVLKTEVDEEAQLSDLFEKAELSDKGKSAAMAAVRLLSSFKDELPPGMVDKLSAIAGIKKEPAMPEDEDKKPTFPDFKNKEAVKKWADEMPEDLKKSILEPADPDTVEGEEMSEDIKKQLEARDLQLTELKKQNEEFQKSLKTERDARETELWIQKAKAELSHYPGKSAEDLGKMLKSLHDVNPEIAIEQFTQMKTASEALKESSLLKSAGVAGGDTSGGSAWKKIEKIASNLMEKADTTFTKSQAINKALEMNPELYADYLAEHPKQTGN